MLTIVVSAPEQAAAVPFNLTVVGGGDIASTEMRISGSPQLQNYLVDEEGRINFPILGYIKAAGMTTSSFMQHLTQEIEAYVKDPIVNVRLVNFQVSVLGEVVQPGTFNIPNEHLSLPKALGLAGDLTIYGKRDNVLVMREENGLTTHKYLDLTDGEIINSTFYYLKQNDVVYVEPNSAQRQASSYNRNSSVYISIASVLVSLIVLISR